MYVVLFIIAETYIQFKAFVCYKIVSWKDRKDQASCGYVERGWRIGGEGGGCEWFSLQGL